MTGAGNAGRPGIAAAMARIDNDDRPSGRARLRELHFADGGSQLDGHCSTELRRQGLRSSRLGRGARSAGAERRSREHDAGDADRHRSLPLSLASTSVPYYMPSSYHANMVNAQLLRISALPDALCQLRHALGDANRQLILGPTAAGDQRRARKGCGFTG